ncbi:aspartate--tRNA ligase [Iamia sp.]|uniref:aspartate--tRNA ligase n=1 Tax=Iamia sp. TaxID=2722710 RepID=UPI002CBBDE4D|nr:aspartate--tRNA ligase [Iamia sp.]HXH57387.1 aspartate--tRNA ligase [Iamia sp.]
MHAYRTHHSRDLGLDDVESTVRVAGWLSVLRDHGGLVFADVRDQSGIVQVVLPQDDEALHATVRDLSRESVVRVTGRVVARPEGTRNPNLDSGDIEVAAEEITVLGRATKTLPFELGGASNVREDVRLRHRFLDLRTERLQRNLRLRSDVLQYIRAQMVDQGFLEVQTPILTSSSPEGARDYLVPSRRYPGRFYALPQAPQQFKQLLMVGGVERYFQIAPCFRDEDGRADRSPGEFYQLDLEMAFATQEDVFAVVETLLDGLFGRFSTRERTRPTYPRITYAEAMARYGTDKPDLRNPLEIVDLTAVFTATDFKAFAGKTVRAIRIPGGTAQSRSFFDKMTDFTKERGGSGLAWLKLDDLDAPAGPIAKFLDAPAVDAMVTAAALEAGDAIVFIADESAHDAATVAGVVRSELGHRLDLLEADVYRFCWIVDFPMFEWDAEKERYDFSHNPFSMPQGGLETLEHQEPGDIVAYQYDIVCNGYELSSGAVRNHDPKLMLKAFAIAGYGPEVVEERFPALYNAFQFGAPPHAGFAPGLDRILMLLADETLIRDVIAFPMTVTGLDLLMGAPGEVTPQQLRDLHIELDLPE